MDFREKSFWLNSRPYSPNDSLSNEITTDVVIIGGGFTGLSTAFHLKQLDPSLDVTLLESEVIGYGASGRNGGFAMTLFGLTMSLTAVRFGKEMARDAQQYMEQAVDYTKELIETHNLDCDFEYNGFLRAATTPKYVKRIQHEIELAHSLGLEGIEWIDQQAIREEVDSPIYLGGWWEPRCGILNPAKLAWEMKRLVESLGVNIYEHTPAEEIYGKGQIRVITPEGQISSDKLVFATNAYSHLLRPIKRKQIPAFTYIVLTRPLTDEDFQKIGWQNRQGIEDARNLVHYYRLTADNRLLMGGGDVGISYGRDMDKDQDQQMFHALRTHIGEVFPSLEDVEITHEWGGPVSIPVDMAPALGYVGDKSMVYSLGCVGHGVSMTQLNGKTTAELVLEKQTDLTDIFFVNRKVIPWPDEPFRLGLSKAIRGYMRTEDRFYERNLG